MEGDQPLQERPRNLPRQRTVVDKLLLVSSVIQFTGLLLCMIYILRASPPLKNESVKVYLMNHDKENGFFLKSSSEFESVQNYSLKIRCDGFYLLSLKGFFSQTPGTDFYRGNHSFYLFSNISSYQYINSVAVVYLRSGDLITQKVVPERDNRKTVSVSQGEISLIQLTNDFCDK
ncbi:tumor necrosis factor ligand superfamily member 4 [Macrotis lagotis]|uniref:tumor necrosis factor ligand superfamily member 4 n=1 Tax=Macrotis lagotis TaxID=92651 RepID=UPI003D69DE88